MRVGSGVCEGAVGPRTQLRRLALHGCLSSSQHRMRSDRLLGLLLAGAFELDGGYATEMSWQGRLSSLYWQERPGVHNSRGRTAQPPLRGETGPDNAAWPVLQGRGGRGRALPHGHDAA